MCIHIYLYIYALYILICVWLIVKSLCFTTIAGYIMLHPRFAKWQNGGTKSTSDVFSDMFCRRLLTIPTPLLTCVFFREELEIDIPGFQSPGHGVLEEKCRREFPFSFGNLCGG